MIHIYSCKVYKFNTEELVETIHCLGFSIFQATHVFQEYVHGDGNRFGFPVEISDVSRVRGINDLINPEFIVEMLDDNEFDGDDEGFHGMGQYDGTSPLKVAKDMMDGEVMVFDCPDCGESIRVPQHMLFPFVKCPNAKCGLEMKRNRIKEAGGIFYYVKENDESKKK